MVHTTKNLGLSPGILNTGVEGRHQWYVLQKFSKWVSSCIPCKYPQLAAIGKTCDFEVVLWQFQGYSKLRIWTAGACRSDSALPKDIWPALPHSHVPLKGRYDTSCSLSRRVMWQGSYWIVHTNAGMVYWLNADNLELLSHNTNYAVSLIPGVNQYSCYFLLI